MRITSKATTLFGVLAASALALTGCSTSAPADDGGKLSIVASTNVWGDVAQQIGGGDVTVTSIITDAAQDPHSYEANARVQLALSKADVVIENGGGYDDFVDTLLGSLDNSAATVLNAVDISRFAHTDDLNEHVWYDLPTVHAVAERIAETLSELDAANAQTFAANARAFSDGLADLEKREADIGAGPHSGAGVAVTEPIPLYMLEACGLVDKTPSAFSEAVEEGTGVAPAVLEETLALFSEHRVRLLVYNAQTMGPESRQVLAAAKEAGIPTVAVTETLPSSQDYLDWMSENIRAVEAALG